MSFEIAMEIEHEVQWVACDDYSLAAESPPHPPESEYDFRSPIGIHIGQIESTQHDMAELINSKYGEY